ncbi:hypothetical protein RHSIM_Rhsim10G0200500 [Rhododendron simsii]|uniref:Chitin-binding type-1 domain-containing protein n=1 Tax=Rhododendron simsii TaxID=118357 RepID=A0A834GD69_RHOSS|nr:hypothetical protein RHSIM_Rhsim10G0200500 [Rhododendron simsii]
MRILALISLSLLSILGALAQHEQCGSQAGGIVCPGGLCCSKWGFCGTTLDFCGDGCQSNCPSPPPQATPPPPASPPPPPSPGGSGDISSLISKALFEKLLPNRNDRACEGNGFYTYEAFIAVAKEFGGFATTGDDETKKREIVAFLAQTSHETTGTSFFFFFFFSSKRFITTVCLTGLIMYLFGYVGGWATAPGGPYAWGYCFVTERNKADYCVPNQQWPCAPGKQYYGRGPIQISYNYNYGPAGRAIGSDLLANPDLVAADAIISFRAALWFWMTPQYSKPSCHDVITGRWTPSAADLVAGRAPGYGVITNIINGGLECGQGFSTPQQVSRIGFLMHFSDIVGVGYGVNLDCNNQRPFG